MRQSTITTQSDSAGEYIVELFDAASPKQVVICVHGRGVRRWDGEEFFYRLAEHYPENAFLLVDQNQFDEDGTCTHNPLTIGAARVQKLITLAQSMHPGVPITVVGHSMGCAVTTMLDLTAVAQVIFISPAAGDDRAKMIKRFGADVAEGKLTVGTDGVPRKVTKAYFGSLLDHSWEEEYEQFLQRYHPVYVYESGDEEVVSEERLAHRDMPFTSYKIIPGAKHNFSGPALELLFTELNPLLKA